MSSSSAARQTAVGSVAKRTLENQKHIAKLDGGASSSPSGAADAAHVYWGVVVRGPSLLGGSPVSSLKDVCNLCKASKDQDRVIDALMQLLEESRDLVVEQGGTFRV